MGNPVDNSLMNVTAEFDIDIEEIDDRLMELQDTMDQLHQNLTNVEMFKIVSKVILLIFVVEPDFFYCGKGQNPFTRLQIQDYQSSC